MDLSIKILAISQLRRIFGMYGILPRHMILERNKEGY